MAVEMSLELFETHLTVFKKEDMQKKMDIAGNVGKQCELRSAKQKDIIEKSHELTGVPKETLMAVKSLEHKSIKFEDWLKEQKQMIQRYSYEYLAVRKLLLKNYTQLLEIPSGIEENKEYEGYKKFFTLVQLPGTKASIIVEKPETVMERHRFLHTKMMYREQKKNIVYIGKINLILNHGKFSYKEDNIEARSRFIVAASLKFGHMGYIYSCGFSQEYMTNWIEEKIIPQLQEQSVIIFQENVINYVNDNLASDLSKEDIINWLNANNICHDPKMHRADLYKLVQTFKQTREEKLSPAELSFRAHGHITIRKKRCNLNNNYFDPYWDFLLHELNTSPIPITKTTVKSHTQAITNTANIIVQNVPLEYWNNLGNILLEKENLIYREDLEIEYVIDKLMTMVKHEGLPKEWEVQNVKLDEYSKTGDKQYLILSDHIMKMYENMQKSQYYKSLNIFK